MKTILKLIGHLREGENTFTELPNPYNMTPRKDDSIVHKEQCYRVLYVEFDFDTNTLYIICKV